VTPRERPGRFPLTRADLPAELTPETLRRLGFRTLRRLADHGNGVLDAEEQQQFDTALADLRRGTASLVDESLQRARRGGPGNLDPDLRRSYVRTQQRLAEQAERARASFPGLVPVARPGDPGTTEHGEPTAEEPQDDDVSPGALAREVEQTSETLDMLERIASLQQQQVEHQERQQLSETRGFFFAFLVSVAVIVAGVAPLVEAEPHDRGVIAAWTVAVTAVAGLVYALVRAVQEKK
jgi:hypothetical protein